MIGCGFFMKGYNKMRDTTKKFILILSVCALLAISGVSVFAKQSMGKDIVNRARDRVESGINEILPKTTGTTGGALDSTPDTTNATAPESTNAATAPIQSSVDTTTKAPEVTGTESTTDAVDGMDENGFNWWGVVIAVVIAAAVVILIIALLPKK